MAHTVIFPETGDEAAFIPDFINSGGHPKKHDDGADDHVDQFTAEIPFFHEDKDLIRRERVGHGSYTFQ
ncbi:MAG: hypothetical protein IJJ80_08200 [Clostridia bacterium]|nr:hypothetical protein [Clostridia bacterium]